MLKLNRNYYVLIIVKSGNKIDIQRCYHAEELHQAGIS